MRAYIQAKLIYAEPMTKAEAEAELGRTIASSGDEQDGYLIRFQDGFRSWAPKGIFLDTNYPISGPVTVEAWCGGQTVLHEEFKPEV